MRVRSLGVAAALLMAGVAGGEASGAAFDGRPLFSVGGDRGYYVWRDGDRWNVRWTTGGAAHAFAGSVEAEGGKLKSLDRIDVEEETRVIQRGRPSSLRVGPRGRVHGRAGRAPVVATREQDRIEKEPGDRRISWTSKTGGDVDGFSFKADDKVRALHFRLKMDGDEHPRQVHIGSDGHHPAGIPFTLVVD